MAKFQIERGTTSVILHVFIQDSTSTTGAGKTGLAYNTANLACKYVRDGETLSSAITLEDISTLGTYAAPTSAAHIRFKELNSASPNAGDYEIHIHNDWVNATGSRRSLVISMGGATGMAPLRIEIQLLAQIITLAIIEGTTVLAKQAKLDTLHDTRIPGVLTADGSGFTALGDARIGNLDAAITSRSSHSAADVWSSVTRTLTAFGFSMTLSSDYDAAKTAASPANVLTQVNAALDAAGTELSTVPSTTGTLRQKINWVFQYFRNKKTVNKSSLTETLFKEDASTTLGTATLADDGTTFTKGEMN